MSGKGHNKPPRNYSRKFGSRWMIAVWDCPDNEKPKHKPYGFCIAWIIYRYMDENGCGVALSNAQISEVTGMSESSVKRGKRWLSKKGLIEILPIDGKRGRKTGEKTRFKAEIPDDTWVQETQVDDKSVGENPYKPGLNGAKDPITQDVARWFYLSKPEGGMDPNGEVQPYHFKEGSKILGALLYSCGGEAVKLAHSEMVTKEALGGVIGPPIPLFKKMCEDRKHSLKAKARKKAKGGVRGQAIPG